MKASLINKLTTKVTKKWAKQIKREERNRSATLRRREYLHSDRVNHSDVADDILPDGYDNASAGGTLPVTVRQFYYEVRQAFADKTDRPLGYQYFSQNLLPRYMRRHATTTAQWRVVSDSRGHFFEPHTDVQVALGTLEVDQYLADVRTHEVEAIEVRDSFSEKYPTCGTPNRISAVLFVEKEGFFPLFKEVALAERFDLAIASSKGQSVVALRHLVDKLCAANDGVPLLVLHDFDAPGLSIAQTLTSVSEAAEDADRVRYRFENEIQVHDLGLRLKDAHAWSLQSEDAQYKKDRLITFDARSNVTKEEKEFLRSKQRVELNAFRPADLVAFIEGKLDKLGIKKVVPDKDPLEAAYHRSLQVALINDPLEAIVESTAETAQKAKVPRGLQANLRKALIESPAEP